MLNNNINTNLNFERFLFNDKLNVFTSRIQERINHIPQALFQISPIEYYRIIKVEYRALTDEQKITDYGKKLRCWLKEHRNRYWSPLTSSFYKQLEQWAQVLLHQSNENADEQYKADYAYQLINCKNLESLILMAKKIRAYHMQIKTDEKFKQIYYEMINYIDLYNDYLPTQTSPANWDKLRNQYFSEFSICYNKNTYFGVDIVVSIETRNNYLHYLDIIKREIKNKKLNLYEQHHERCIIGKNLFDQLKQYASINNICRISVEDFIICLLKAIESAPLLTETNWLANWNKTEYRLLANTSKIIRNVEALTKTTFNTRIDDKIKSLMHPRFDAILINGPLLELIDFNRVFPGYHPNDFNFVELHYDIKYINDLFERSFHYENYKIIIKERLLPALKYLSSVLGSFLFALPVMSCHISCSMTIFSFAINKKFKQAVSEMICENFSAFPHLEGVLFTGDEGIAVDECELILCQNKTIPIISTRKYIESAPQSNSTIFKQFDREMPPEKIVTLSHCHVVTGVQANPIHFIPDAPIIGNTTILNKMTKQKGKLIVLENQKEELFYQPLNKDTENFYCQSMIINTLNIISKLSEPPKFKIVESMNQGALYNQLFAIINDADINHNQIKQIRLHAIHLCLSNSKKEDDILFTREIKKYFLIDSVNYYLKNHTIIMLAQICLSGLSSVENMSLFEQLDLEKYLNMLLNNPEKNCTLQEFTGVLEAKYMESKKRCALSFFYEKHFSHYLDTFLNCRLLDRCRKYANARISFVE